MDVRAGRQDLREIAALVIDLDDKEHNEPKDAGYKCARHLLEAQRGEVHRAADYSIANGTINQDLSIVLYQIPLIRTRGPIGAVRWT